MRAQLQLQTEVVVGALGPPVRPPAGIERAAKQCDRLVAVELLIGHPPLAEVVRTAKVSRDNAGEGAVSRSVSAMYEDSGMIVDAD